MEIIISYLLSPEKIPPPFGGILDFLRILFFVLSFILVAIMIFSMIKSDRLKTRLFENASEFLTFKAQGSDKMAKNWKKIMKKLESGLESEYKLGIIEADTMLGDALDRIGHIEETVEQKLGATTASELQNVEDVKRARKVRNDVVYDPDYHLTLDKAKEVLTIYEKAFKNIGIFS